MTEPTIRTLLAIEYDAFAIGANLDDLAGRLDCCRDCPRAKVAAGQLRKLKQMLAHVLDHLDHDVTLAIKAAEQLFPAPF